MSLASLKERYPLAKAPQRYTETDSYVGGCSCGHEHICVGFSMPYAGRVCLGPCAPHTYDGECYGDQ